VRTYFPAAKVGPVSLLVPCCALAFAWQLVGEARGGRRLIGLVIVLGGVALGIFGLGIFRSGQKEETGAKAPVSVSPMGTP
jgi:drug/metabolite transporter (DMT)-like permease